MVTNRGQDKSGSGVQDRVLSVLLNEMDGIGSNSQSAARSKVGLNKVSQVFSQLYCCLLTIYREKL